VRAQVLLDEGEKKGGREGGREEGRRGKMLVVISM